MKRIFLNILATAAILTTIAFLMDGDIKEPSMLMRFVEFFGMMGILFVLISTFYFTSNLIFKNLQRI
ncbi:hypothetical protein [Flavobacterium terrigena]|uniref:Uncharacterized protein n=1 Tax=Flavobacterium terrigena TaxID=402734 RepID=A0A1H6S5Z0_9FLAO|nr:hypothetical protein [Flavobacterium terrigena]SEI61284.1 hypothetical protein SAMN05660918_1146 [Flavobacterium terrigena]